MKKATKSIVKVGTNVAVTKLTGSATLGNKMSKVAGKGIGPVSKKSKKKAKTKKIAKREKKHEKKGYHPENDPTSKKYKKREKKHKKKGSHPEKSQK